MLSDELFKRTNTIFHTLITSLVKECDYAGDTDGVIPVENVVHLIEKSLNDMKLTIDEFNSLVKR